MKLELVEEWIYRSTNKGKGGGLNIKKKNLIKSMYYEYDYDY